MTVHPLRLELRLSTVFPIHRVTEFCEHAVHHLVAIVKGELLRPVQIAHVCTSLLIIYRPATEISTRELHAALPASVLGDSNVEHRDPAGRAAKRALPCDPHRAAGVFRQ